MTYSKMRHSIQIAKIFFWCIGIGLFFFVSAKIGISYLHDYLLARVNSALAGQARPIQVAAIHPRGLNQVSLTHCWIGEQEGRTDTLFYCKSIDLSLSLRDLVFQDSLQIESIRLWDASLHTPLNKEQASSEQAILDSLWATASTWLRTQAKQLPMLSFQRLEAHRFQIKPYQLTATGRQYAPEQVRHYQISFQDFTWTEAGFSFDFQLNNSSNNSKKLRLAEARGKLFYSAPKEEIWLRDGLLRTQQSALYMGEARMGRLGADKHAPVVYSCRIDSAWMAPNEWRDHIPKRLMRAHQAQQVLRVSPLHLTGNAQQLNINHFALRYGKNTSTGTGTYTWKDSTFVLQVEHALLDNLRRLWPNKALHASLKGAEWTGQLRLRPNRMQLEGVIALSVGSLAVRLRIDDWQRPPKARYRLSVDSHDLSWPLNAFARTFHNRRFSIEGTLSGNALFHPQARYEWNLRVRRSIDEFGRTLGNVRLSGLYNPKRITAEYEVNDALLQSKGQLAYADHMWQLAADVPYATLAPLGLSSEPLLIQGQLSGQNLQLVERDAVLGTLSLANFKASYRQKHYDLDTLSLSHARTPSGYAWRLHSQPLNLHITQNQLLRLNKATWAATKKTLQSMKDMALQDVLFGSPFLIQWMQDSTKHYQLAAEARLYALLPYIRAFSPQLAEMETVPQGYLCLQINHKPYEQLLGASWHLKKLRFKQQVWTNLNGHLSHRRTAQSAPQGILSIRADQWANEQKFSLDEPYVSTNWHAAKVAFGAGFGAQTATTHMRLRGHGALMKDLFWMSFDPSELHFFDQVWRFSTPNRIQVARADESFTFQNLVLLSKSARVALQGAWAKNSNQMLNVQVSGLDLSPLSSLSAHDIAGTVSLNWQLGTSRQPQAPKGILCVDNIQIGGTTYGYAELSLEYEREAVLVNGHLQHPNGTGYVEIKGRVPVSPFQNNLELQLDCKQIPVSYLHPWAQHTFADMKGFFSGKLRVHGSRNNVLIDGRLYPHNLSVVYKYLNANFAIDGAFAFRNHDIIFENVSLTDPFGTKALLWGYVTHNGFAPLTLSLAIYADNFYAANIVPSNAALYYGQIYASGELHLEGNKKDLLVYGELQAQSGTQIYVPYGEDASSSDWRPFIRFAHTEEAPETQKQSVGRPMPRRKEQHKLRLSLNISVQEGAKWKLITNKVLDEYIQVSGTGNIKLESNPSNPLALYGYLYITQGQYRFSPYSFLGKTFNIQRGSQIAWRGEPMNPLLDIFMVHSQNTSLAPIEVSQFQGGGASAGFRKTNVLTQVKGTIQQPQVFFDIDIENYPNLPLFKQRILADEQELKRQVLSLLFLNQFSVPRDLLDVDESTDMLASGAREMLSQQMMSFVSKVDERAYVDVDLVNQRMRMLYAFLDGRLYLSREGDFAPQTASASQGYEQWIGNWDLEYFISQNRRFRLRGYFREGDNTSLTESTATGVSLRYFSQFDKLFDTRRKRKPRKSAPDAR